MLKKAILAAFIVIFASHSLADEIQLTEQAPTSYIVKKGDSLWTIAKKFKKVTVNQIKEWNNIWSGKSIQPGKKLKIFKS